MNESLWFFDKTVFFLSFSCTCTQDDPYDSPLAMTILKTISRSESIILFLGKIKLNKNNLKTDNAKKICVCTVLMQIVSKILNLKQRSLVMLITRQGRLLRLNSANHQVSKIGALVIQSDK